MQKITEIAQIAAKVLACDLPLTKVEIDTIKNYLAPLIISGQINILGKKKSGPQPTAFSLKAVKDSPPKFSEKSGIMVEGLLEEVPDFSTCVFVIPHRGGSSFLAGLLKKFKDAHVLHIKAKRFKTEAGMEANVEYLDPDDIIKYKKMFQDGTLKTLVFVDPMLATAATELEILNQLSETIGYDKKNLISISIFSAPEGITRTLQEYPDTKFIAWQMASYLKNEAEEKAWLTFRNGFVFGDWGDYWSSCIKRLGENGTLGTWNLSPKVYKRLKEIYDF